MKHLHQTNLFDAIIVGAGCAGWSLAYHLTKAQPELSILLIDKHEKTKNDRTWCFWGKCDDILQSMVSHEWHTLSVLGEGADYTNTLKDSYKYISGRDFYAGMRQALPNCQFLQAEVSIVNENASEAFVLADGIKISAKYVFDSRLDKSFSISKTPDTFHLAQHFKGWKIRTSGTTFDTRNAKLMDFRVPQGEDGTHFFYVLPFSENEALVEFTSFSPNQYSNEIYDTALSTYIKEQLGIEEYEVMEVEQGSIPMTNATFKSKQGKRIWNIGTRAGWVKPTTGYAFTRIWRRSRSVAHAALGIEAETSNFSVARFELYDRLLLHILTHRSELGKPIFLRLFRYNSMNRVLDFLDERSNLLQEGRIFASLPKQPFLEALYKTSKITRSTKGRKYAKTINPLI